MHVGKGEQRRVAGNAAKAMGGARGIAWDLEGVHTRGRKVVAPKAVQPRGVWVGEFSPENSWI